MGSVLALAWFAACGDSPPPVIQPLGPVPSGTAGLGASMVTAGQAAAGSGTTGVAGGSALTAGASAAGAAAGGAATAGASAIAGAAATAGSSAVAGATAAAGSTATAGSTALAGNSATAGNTATAGAGALAGTSGSAGGAAGGTGTFTQVVKIFNDHYCGTCHAMAASDSANGSLMFNSATADKTTLYNTFVGATSKSAQCSGKAYVTKGSPEQSLLYDKLANATPACGMRMPIGGQLTTDEIAIVRSWIMAGAAND